MHKLDDSAKPKMNRYADTPRHVKIGDIVFVKQRVKKKSDLPYCDKPYHVYNKKGILYGRNVKREQKDVKKLVELILG